MHVPLRPLLALALAATPAAALAAQGIHGTVKDQATGRPIVAASVTLLSSRGKSLDHVLTDSTGVFLLQPEDAGSYALKATGLGYETATSAPVPVKDGELVEVTLLLGVHAVPLEPLTVTARSFPPNRYLADAGFYERKRAGVGVFLTRDDILRQRPDEFSDLMRSIPGMAVTPTGPAGRRGYSMTGRSNARCQPALILDGTPTLIGGMQPLRGRDLPLDDVLSPGDIEGMELYRGPAGVPSEFNVNNAGCGVLVIWTRHR